MSLRTLMQAGPAKANELFARLAETSVTAVKTRERLFGELKAALEQHVDLEQTHLFPILRKQPDTKDLVAGVIRDNKELRARLNVLDELPKNDEAFLGTVAELQKAFREHARDEKRELLPAVAKALSEDQIQTIVEKMETTLAEAEQLQQNEAEEKRAAHRQLREQDEAERAPQRAGGAVAKAAKHAAEDILETTIDRTTEVAASVARSVQGTAVRTTEAVAQATQRSVDLAMSPARTGMLLWDMMMGGVGIQPGRTLATRETTPLAQAGTSAPPTEEVISLAEEVLEVGKRTVITGTTRIRRFVVETPAEQQVSLVRERVVIERRRPASNKLTGESLTELTIEVVETDEEPTVSKTVQLREEIVVRTERAERIETVRDTVRQDKVEIKHAASRRPVRV